MRGFKILIVMGLLILGLTLAGQKLKQAEGFDLPSATTKPSPTPTTCPSPFPCPSPSPSPPKPPPAPRPVRGQYMAMVKC